jgi:hypothetical protein
MALRFCMTLIGGKLEMSRGHLPIIWNTSRNVGADEECLVALVSDLL